MKKIGVEAEAHLSAEQIYAIGLLTVEFVYAEREFEGVLWGLAGIESALAGMAITSHMITVNKVEVATTLANSLLYDEKIKADVLAAIKEFDRLRVERNKVIHGWWLRGSTDDADPTLNFDVSARGITRMKVKVYKTETITQLVRDLKALHEMLHELRGRVPPPTPGFPASAILRLFGASIDLDPTEPEFPSPSPRGRKR